MSETLWTHAGLVLGILVPITLYWLSSRRHAERNHADLRERLVALETKLEPVWDWWNKANGKT